MTADMLLKEIDRLLVSPAAVQQLRRFVLDMAVRGRLTEREPADEPADLLLAEIEQRLAEIRPKSLKRRRSAYPPVGQDEEPFPLPGTWLWVRVRQVTRDRGQVVPADKFTYIDVTAIDNEAGRLRAPTVLMPDEAPSRARRIVACGDVLYSCVRPYLLNVAVVEADMDPAPIASTAFAVLDGLGLVEPRYLWAVLRSPYFVAQVEERMRGQAYPAINDADFSLLPIPLPPLGEQRRIVAKIDQWMAICNGFEARLNASEAIRESLRRSALQCVANPGNDREEVRPALEALGELFTLPEHVDALRHALLDLAVQGQLVPQDAADEPAVELLARIAAKTAVSRDLSDLSVNIPGWTAATIAEISSLVTSGSRGWAQYYSPSGPTFIRAQNVRFGRMELANLAHVALPARTEGTRTRVDRGDILIVITGAGVTNPAMVDSDLGEAYVSQHIGLVKLTCTATAPWVLLCMMAPSSARGQLVECAYGAGKPGLNLDNIRKLVIPLPPLAEQGRIILKVKQLMNLCDDLELLLSRGKIARDRAMTALLQHALE
ncbi:restriction endonuclease subunit S [Micromonospora haikouensis]|uniref:restriction endonuclease subunit S n=1 Tax=Micromonospora haikouensis TaxID=686309 RepID=UPI00379537BD